MHYFLKEYQDCLRQVVAHFTQDEVNAEFDVGLSALQKKVQFPGYRAGKVPFDIIEKNYADELMRSIVNGIVVKMAEKLHQDGVHLYSEPRFKPLSGLNRNQPFSFSIVFDSVPRVIENINLDTTTIEFDEYFYDDKMMTYSMQKDMKNLESVTSKIEEEDTITAKVLNKGYTGNSELTLDASIVKALVGKKAGDKVKLTFAELDIYVVEFLGKVEGDVELEITKVERPSVQDLTDELVQQVSIFKTVDEYQKAMKNRFDSMQQEFNTVAKKNALMAYMSKNAKVEFPKSEFIRDAQREIQTFVENHFHVTEPSLGGLLADPKVREDFSALPDKVRDNIVFFIAVKDIADKNGIRADQALIDKMAASRAKEHEMTIDEFKQKASREEWMNVTEMAKFEAALDFLISKIKFKAKAKQPLIKMK